jgi:hypothetical protein
MSQEASVGRAAQNNVRNGANGMVSNTWKPFFEMDLIQFHLFHLFINTSPSSPIKVPPTSCDVHRTAV